MESLNTKESFATKEQEELVHEIVEKNGIAFQGLKVGYFYFGFPELSLGRGGVAAEIKNLHRNPNKMFSEEEIKKMVDFESDVFKLHLEVPPERKLEVLELIVRNHMVDLREKGVGPGTLLNFKMIEKISSHYPTFVFYVRHSPENKKRQLKEMAHNLRDLIEQAGLEQSDKIPRFSAPVVVDGEEVPGLTYVHGGGDVKDHVLRTHGEEMLSKFYDKENNFASRVDENIDFDDFEKE
jgi:hypothetical protein